MTGGYAGSRFSAPYARRAFSALGRAEPAGPYQAVGAYLKKLGLDQEAARDRRAAWAGTRRQGRSER
jgi:hypothetical protein